MDNLTHSLIGAALGQAGLKRKTGLAMPALIIAANLPDIDDEQRVAIEPLARERLQQPDAVIVEPIEQRMGQRADKAKPEQPAEMDW